MAIIAPLNSGLGWFLFLFKKKKKIPGYPLICPGRRPVAYMLMLSRGRYDYCVEISGGSGTGCSSSSSSFTSSPTSSSTPTLPYRTQSGIISSYDQFQVAVAGDYCCNSLSLPEFAAAPTLRKHTELRNHPDHSQIRKRQQNHDGEIVRLEFYPPPQRREVLERFPGWRRLLRRRLGGWWKYVFSDDDDDANSDPDPKRYRCEL